jgi:hypothetical protein
MLNLWRQSGDYAKEAVVLLGFVLPEARHNGEAYKGKGISSKTQHSLGLKVTPHFIDKKTKVQKSANAHMVDNGAAQSEPPLL